MLTQVKTQTPPLNLIDDTDINAISYRKVEFNMWLPGNMNALTAPPMINFEALYISVASQSHKFTL